MPPFLPLTHPRGPRRLCPCQAEPVGLFVTVGSGCGFAVKRGDTPPCYHNAWRQHWADLTLE